MSTITKYFDPQGAQITETWWSDADDGTRHHVAALTDEQRQALGITTTVEEVAPPPPMPPAVPSSVTARQAKSAILLAGWLGTTDEQVEANGYLLFDSMPEPNRSLGRIAWRESNDFQRNNPLVAAMLTALGKTSQQGDALFIQAATL